MTDTFEKTYTDWSIDVGTYKYEGITLNEVEQNLYAIEDQEQDFVVISPSKAISIDNKLYNFVQVCSDQDTDLLHIEISVTNDGDRRLVSRIKRISSNGVVVAKSYTFRKFNSGFFASSLQAEQTINPS